MAQAKIEVTLTKSDHVTYYKERIEQLFDVVINFTTSASYTNAFDDDKQCDNPSPTFTLQVSSSSSQENIEKATIFLEAILEKSPEFTVICQHLSPKDFEMVLKNSQIIEHQFLSVLDFDFSALEVCLKGKRENVKAAQGHISRMIMGMQDNLTHHRHPGTDYQPGQNKQNVVSSSVLSQGDNPLSKKNCDIFSSTHRDQDNNVILDPNQPLPLRSFSVTTDEDVEYPSILGSCLTDRGNVIKSSMMSRTFAEVVSLKDNESNTDMGKGIGGEDSVEYKSIKSKVKETVWESTSSSSCEEDIISVDKSDPRYHNRLEFAVKLGYEERDLDRVIMRHGLDCNEDKLLHELIENSAGTIDPESMVVERVSPVPVAPDIANSEVFLGVMKKVTKSEEDGGSTLHPIVIDGSNVAMSHGKNIFSCRGIKIAVDWFKQRGHKEITVFVPQWRKETSRPDTPITDQDILLELEKEGIVVFTPARRIKGKRVVCYDDRFVLKLAADTNGIVVSNDNYRDLLTENKEYRTVVDERLLMYTFVNDRFMPPEDPLGRHGPTLDDFLCKEPANPPSLPPDCPYGRKCTYGNKCKYHHPERGSQPHRTVTEVLKEQANIKMQERAAKGPEPLDKSRRAKLKLTRTRSLAHGEPVAEKSLSALPPALQEPDSEAINRQKSPTRSGGKKSDYLTEYRKKLEEIIASAPPDPGVSRDQTSTVPKVPVSASAGRCQAGLIAVAAGGSGGSSPSHLNVPYSNSQEGQLVSGHLLLAKKLSDEASESSFFSNESSSNRASPVVLAGPAMVGVSRQESLPHSMDRVSDRRPSLQDHRKQHLPYPPFFTKDTESMMGMPMSGSMHLQSCRSPGFQQDSSLMAGSGFGTQYQNYPMSEKEATRSVLRRVTSYSDQSSVMGSGVALDAGHRDHLPLKPQHSCPPNQFQPPVSASFTRQPSFGGMVRQNSCSDPQLHMTVSGDACYGLWHGNSMASSQMPMLDQRAARSASGGLPDRTVYSESQRQHKLYPPNSMQPFRSQQSYTSQNSMDGQFSEVMFGSQEKRMGMPSWEAGGMYHSHPSTPTQQAQTPTHMQCGMMQNTRMAAWPQSPLHQMPLSPVKSTQPAPRVFPANQPIPPNDPRYSLYYHLCNIFAEPRVRAVMNKYPDETNPQSLCARIVSEL